MIEVDFGNSVGVYLETLNGWLSEAGISPISVTDRERVISGIVAGLEAMGRSNGLAIQLEFESKTQ